MESPQNYELSQVPLDDLLLALEVTKSSVDLHLESTVGQARLSVLEGRLDDASFGDQEGPDAVLSMLSLQDGRFELSAKLSNTKGLNKSLAKIVQEKMRSSGPLNLARTVSQPPVSAPLERTGKALPQGLEAIELRTLAMVNGSLSTLDIAAQEKGSPAASLNAIRRLAQFGLIRTGKRGTLALGTRIPLSSKDTLQALPSMNPMAPAGDSRLTEDAEPGESERPRKSSSNKPVPARLRRLGSSRPRDTGYSSVPPPALAEEHVKLPSSLRGTEKIPQVDEVPPLVAPKNVQRTKPLRSDEPPVSLEPVPSGKIQSALNAATVLPDDGLHVSRTFTPEPIDPSITQESTFSGPSEALGAESEAIDSLPPARPRMDSDEIGPDPVVVDAARGQLRDSELPVPSSRLGHAALEQLDELNDAVVSSRKPSLPKLKAAQEYSQDLRAPGSVPHPDLLPGNATTGDSELPTVGRYEVLARLKRGGMGSVYMCRLSGNAGFRRHFAMKVLHGHLAKQPDALDSFFHEARVLGGLHHRNIVGIADVGTPTEPYFVLEYVEGGSLAELYRATRDGRDPGMVLSVILDALNGLAAAHAATGDEGEPLELVHCDVTPHNLLVGVDGTCRVTDFGIARTAREPAGEITRGKPGYIAPERLARKPTDHRSDLFSLGVVLYAGLAGCEPFAGETADETMRNILDKPITPPSETGFRPPPSLDWVCMKALARDPKERFQSAEEMASQLRRIAEREGLLASPTEVAAWVTESLAPTLAARRAASLRGTTTESSRYRPSTIPPGVGDLGVPVDSPSAAEHTGPLEPPASSRGFQEQTEILSGAPQAPEAESSRVRTFGVYAALACAVAALVWVALSPGSLGGFLRTTPPEANTVQQGTPKSPTGAKPSAEPTAPIPRPARPSPTATQDDADGIVIPAIVPSQGDK